MFAEPRELPPRRTHEHKIPSFPGHGPTSVKPYRYPYFQKSEIEKLVGEMLSNYIICTNTSPYSSPKILVRKHDGFWRMCVDYKALNKIAVKDKFLIPVIDELLDEQHGAQIFLKLDLHSGYHQIRMHSKDVEKTTFHTYKGHYEFLVMSFKLTNAPSSI